MLIQILDTLSKENIKGVIDMIFAPCTQSVTHKYVRVMPRPGMSNTYEAAFVPNKNDLSVRNILDGSKPINSHLRMVIVDPSVTVIAKGAFEYCVMLKRIVFPPSVIEIHPYTFTECESLKQVILPPFMTVLEEGLFIFCVNLTRVLFSSLVKDIRGFAFAYCCDLEEMDISTVERVNNTSFASCTGLKSLILPKGMQTDFLNLPYWTIVKN